MTQTPDIMRTEYVVQDESGQALDWCDSLDAAIAAAGGFDEPTLIERVDEYFPDKEIVWASHGSAVEAQS